MRYSENFQGLFSCQTQVKKEFEKLWGDPLSFPLEEVIEEYPVFDT